MLYMSTAFHDNLVEIPDSTSEKQSIINVKKVRGNKCNFMVKSEYSQLFLQSEVLQQCKVDAYAALLI